MCSVTRIYIHTRIYIYIYVYIHIHTYIYLYTHTPFSKESKVLEAWKRCERLVVFMLFPRDPNKILVTLEQV